MASFQSNVILAYVTYAVLMIGTIVVIADTATLKGSACNGRGIELVSDYALVPGISPLDQAVKHTPETGYNYHGGTRYMSAIAYSHGQCNGEIVTSGCERCMKVVRRYMIMYCETNTGQARGLPPSASGRSLFGKTLKFRVSSRGASSIRTVRKMIENERPLCNACPKCDALVMSSR